MTLPMMSGAPVEGILAVPDGGRGPGVLCSGMVGVGSPDRSVMSVWPRRGSLPWQ